MGQFDLCIHRTETYLRDQEDQKGPGMIPGIRMSIKESETPLKHGVILESWFNRDWDFIVRTEIYKAKDGSVVAYQDCIEGKWEPLHVEKNFLELNEEEDNLRVILESAGVFDINKIVTFNCGR